MLVTLIELRNDPPFCEFGGLLTRHQKSPLRICRGCTPNGVPNRRWATPMSISARGSARTTVAARLTADLQFWRILKKRGAKNRLRHGHGRSAAPASFSEWHRGD